LSDSDDGYYWSCHYRSIDRRRLQINHFGSGVLFRQLNSLGKEPLHLVVHAHRADGEQVLLLGVSIFTATIRNFNFIIFNFWFFDWSQFFACIFVVVVFDAKGVSPRHVILVGDWIGEMAQQIRTTQESGSITRR